VSDSILYLAIVAIWAGFLIPAWVRRPHHAKSEYEAESVDFAEAGADQPADASFDRPAEQPDLVRSDLAVETDTEVHVTVNQGNSEYGYDVHMHSYDAADYDSGEAPMMERPVAEPCPPQSSQSRQQMMRARRRMLTILTALTLITLLFVVSGLVQWWICVPPVGMLALYVALLREIAMADAELAQKKQAWEARQAHAEAAHTAWQRSHQAWLAEVAEPTAEIIDISSRVVDSDQLYDQYADAAVRAVGD
jgi:hypothetical protein